MMKKKKKGIKRRFHIVRADIESIEDERVDKV